jgi:hypothetical protein
MSSPYRLSREDIVYAWEEFRKRLNSGIFALIKEDISVVFLYLFFLDWNSKLIIVFIPLIIEWILNHTSVMAI